jgi:hypothetical protein
MLAIGEVMMRGMLGMAGLFVVVLSIVSATACEDTTPNEAERAAVDSAVSSYLNALAESYSTLDTGPLQGVASPNEIAAVRMLLRSLVATGDRVQSSLLVYDTEHMEIFREINATVRLVEVWDVVRYDATSGVQKGHTPDSIQYTLLQLRKVEGTWIVVGRSVLSRETPVPDSGEGTPE